MTTTAVTFSLEAVKEEVQHLVEEGLVRPANPIVTLCHYFSNREWVCIEVELEKNDFLPHDHILDLLDYHEWDED